MPSPFDGLCGPGKPLKAEPPDEKEFAGLVSSGTARLKVGLGPEVWRVLAKCHDIRNVSEYEGILEPDERIVGDLIHACEAVSAKVSALRA